MAPEIGWEMDALSRQIFSRFVDVSKSATQKR
jgi:hypothetical protein